MLPPHSGFFLKNKRGTIAYARPVGSTKNLCTKQSNAHAIRVGVCLYFPVHIEILSIYRTGVFSKR